jgi:hypothetical protein
MTTPTAAQQAIDQAERRRQVAALWLAGHRNQQRIAETLKVNQSTISKDLKALKDEWRAQALEDIDDAKAEDIQRIDQLLVAVMPQAKQGHLGAVDRAVSLLKRRADIFGYDAPKRTENKHEGPDGEPLTITVIRHHAPPEAE